MSQHLQLRRGSVAKQCSAGPAVGIRALVCVHVIHGRQSAALHGIRGHARLQLVRSSLKPQAEVIDKAAVPTSGPYADGSSSADATAAAAPAPVPPAAWRWEESDDAVRAYGALVGLLLLGQLPLLQSHPLADLPYFVGLAITTIYIGAHKGLTSRQRQQISIKEGALAPVLASCSLFGFYLVIKYFPEISLQTVLNAYFWLLGSFAIGGAAVPVLRKVGGPLGKPSIKFDVPDGWLLEDDGVTPVKRAELAVTDILSVGLALGLATVELQSGHSNFSLNNLVACLIATDILQLIGVRSFRTALLLLVGLLVYDVFWVFGSPKVIGDNVMLTVATSDMITGPTRILFPRFAGSTGEGSQFPFSLLGLGDIAIPGLLACLALRYDATRSVDMRARAAAAVDAIQSVLAGLDPDSSGKQMGEAVAAAAEAAYDRVADREAAQRNATLDGSNNDSGDRAAGAAARTLLRTVAAAATSQSGQSTLGASRASISSAASLDGGEPIDAAAEPILQPVSTAAAAAGSPPAAETALPVTDAALYQRMYFTPVMYAYVLGLVGAFVANSVTNLGQPALLYIVPATLGAVAATGAQRGELARLWSFNDVPSFGMQSHSHKEEDVEAEKN